MFNVKTGFAIVLIVALALCFGCKESKKTVIPVASDENTAPQIAAIPDQAAVVNVDFSVDLTPYVSDAEDDIALLTFYVVSGGGSFTGAAYENTFAAAGTITINFLVMDTGGMYALGSFDVIVSAGTKPLVADFSASATYGPAPLDVTFTDMSTGSVTAWSWDFGDTGTSTEQGPSYQYATPGIYTVSLTVTGTGGSDTMTKTSYIQVLGGTSGIIYVDGASTATTPDGTSWALAFPHIQSGIDAATDYDVVLVADGTYTGSTNKELDFAGKAISVRAYDLHGSGVTTIDCEGSNEAFVFDDGETAEAVVDGFTIVNGSALGGGAFAMYGAGPTIRSCRMLYGDAVNGGAMMIYAVSSPVVEDCEIAYNVSGSDGAGVYVGETSSAVFVNCSIHDNSAGATAGGGIRVGDTSSLTLVNTRIYDNYAGEGGGLHSFYSATTVEGCQISGNIASSSGGGIFVTGGSLATTKSLISANHCEGDGGGICYEFADVSLTDTVITGNSARSSGGGIYATDAPSTLVMDGCSVTGNSSGQSGGGIFSSVVDATANDCFVSNNTVISVSNPVVGGGLALYDSSWTMTGCTVSGNTANSISSSVSGGGIYAGAMGSGTLDMTDCPVSGNTAEGYRFAYGGAMTAEGNVPVAMTDCTVSQNTARVFYSDISDAFAEGGGVYYSSTTESLALTRVTVSGNSLLCNIQGNAGSYFGGGIFVLGDAAITDCIVTDNRLSLSWAMTGTVPLGGGGIAAGDDTTEAGNVLITGCTITGNEILASTGDENDTMGGGVFFRGDELMIQNSTVSDNSISSNDYCYGGGIFAEGGLLTVEDTAVSDNSAEGYVWGAGGGICSAYDYATVTGCTISGNSLYVKGAINQVFGGGLCSRQSPATSEITVADCVIDGNSVTGDLPTGSGGGGVYVTSTFARFFNCAITGNVSSGDGGGVLFENTESDMDFCTLSANSAKGNGGALCADSLDLTAWDVILWSNTAATSGNEIYVPSGPVDLHYCVVPSAAQDPDRFEGPSITEYAGCVNADPLFVTGPGGSYYLDPASPASDAGSDTAVNRGVDGKTTRADGAPDTGTADIGYHYPLP